MPYLNWRCETMKEIFEVMLDFLKQINPFKRKQENTTYQLTNKGKMFLRWYDENQNEIEGLSFEEMLDEFEKYYNSIFNKRI